MRTPFLTTIISKPTITRTTCLQRVRKKEMPNDKRKDEQCHARSDTAAFSRDFDIKVRKMKDETFSKSRNPHKVKNHFCDIGGSLLQEIDRMIQQNVR